jgi:hypothetical protein
MTVAAKGLPGGIKMELYQLLTYSFHNRVFYPYAGVPATRSVKRLCNNRQARQPQAMAATAMLDVRMTQWKRVLLWLMLAALAVLVTYAGIRGYLSADMLFNFANSFSC